MLNISALILDWLQVKKESQSNFNLISNAPKVGNFPDFSIVQICLDFSDLSGGANPYLVILFCTTPPNILSRGILVV